MDIEQILSTVGLVIIVLSIFYAGTWQRRKQQKELKKMQDNLKKDDRIITFSGLTGIVDEVIEDRVIVRIYPEKNKVSFEKWAIAGLDDRKIE
ncbi:MAG: preprotein translocase subunit YajC [Clostridia bacterium]|nr:preprotein translocase subunit YajC [Clostridia bacterium]